MCIEGPRFSTRAESKYYREVVGAQIIGMTLVPECVLAREAEICYVSLATITDFDVWAQHPVSSQGILTQLQENIGKIKTLIKELILETPKSRRRCSCGISLKRRVGLDIHFIYIPLSVWFQNHVPLNSFLGDSVIVFRHLDPFLSPLQESLKDLA